MRNAENMLHLDLEGKVYPSFTYTIPRTKVKEINLAVGDSNPLLTDSAYAQTRGYKDTPCPLTFLSAVDMWGSNESAWSVLEEVGLDLKRMLDLKKEFEYFAPVYPGDTLTVSLSVESLYDTTIIDKAVFKTVYYRDKTMVAIGRLTVGVIK